MTAIITQLTITPTLEASETQPTPILHIDNLALLLSLGSGIYPYRYLILPVTRIL